MPLHDYECPTCGSRAEDNLSYGPPVEALPCPSGCPEGMWRLPAAPAFHLKGWGWTGKLHHRGLRADWKSSEDTLEEDSNGKLRPKTGAGAGHDAP